MKILKFLLLGLIALTVLLLASLAAAAWWLSNHGVLEQVRSALEQSAGVPVTLKALSLAAKPALTVEVEGLQIETKPPLSVKRMELQPDWRALLGVGQTRRLIVRRVVIDQPQLSERGVQQLLESIIKKNNLLSNREQTIQSFPRQTAKNELNNPGLAGLAIGILTIPEQVQVHDLTWQTIGGDVVAASADIQVNDERDTAHIKVELGGGHIQGQLQLAQLQAQASWRLQGEFNTQQVNLQALPGVKTRLSGRLTAITAVKSSAGKLNGLLGQLTTETNFSMQDAVLLGIDITKAVKTLGLSRSGQTSFEQLTGRLETTGFGHAQTARLFIDQAQSKFLKVSGEVSIGSPEGAGGTRALNGKLSVDLNAGDGVGKLASWVGIPLLVGGTTQAPEIRPTTGALLGGAVGSVAAPVLGTAVGAKLGDQVEQTLSGWKQRLFGK